MKTIQNHKLIRSNVNLFLYLFITDIARIPFQTYQEYEQNEPGYSLPYFEAYTIALNEKMDGRMSHELIKKINQIAMSHMPNIPRGEYRTEAGNFMISFEENSTVINPAYSATLEGVHEFLSYWLLSHKSPSHVLALESITNPFTNSYAITFENGQLIFKSIVNKIVKDEPFNESKHWPLILSCSRDAGYEFYINIMAFSSKSRDVNIRNKTENLMQIIFNEFHNEISHDLSADDKIRVIAKHIQRIEQLHPFPDGNIRTCSILLNKLLNDYGLSLSILLNPNKLDCCSLNDVVQMIKDGQKIYQKLLNNESPSQFIIETTEQIPQLKRITCLPYNFSQSLVLDSFFNAVTECKHPSLNPVLDAPQHFFSPSENTQVIESIRKLKPSEKGITIIKHLEKGNYSCALRNACNLRELSIIKELLTYSKNFNVNEPSSNGNTALDWFDVSKIEFDPALLATTRDLLIEHGAKNKTPGFKL